MIRLIAPFVFVAALAACATAPTYQASVTPNGPGYSEQQVESNRFFVTYRAPQGADAATVADFALLRAADLTLAHNRDWFWVDNHHIDTSQSGYGGPSVGVSLGGASFGSHSAAGVGVGFNFPIGHPHETASAATLEIRFGEGVKPDAANAYDAHSISTNLRSRLNTHG